MIQSQEILYDSRYGDVARCSQYNEAKVGTEITEGENELWL